MKHSKVIFIVNESFLVYSMLKMKKLETRHTQILEMITDKKKVDVSELALAFNVSQVTIRKDLIQLEEKGLIKREHGFATLNAKDDINTRLAYHYDKKLKIAKKAIESVKDGETVMIESGSSCALVALELAINRKDITIITNSAFVADFIRKVNQSKIVLLGGEYQNEAQVMVGPMTKRCASNFFVDKLFVGTDGYSDRIGFTGNDLMRAEAVRDMAEQANKVIVVTDSIKFKQSGVVPLIKTERIFEVVTDFEMDDEIKKSLENRGIKVSLS